MKALLLTFCLVSFCLFPIQMLGQQASDSGSGAYRAATPTIGDKQSRKFSHRKIAPELRRQIRKQHGERMRQSQADRVQEQPVQKSRRIKIDIHARRSHRVERHIKALGGRVIGRHSESGSVRAVVSVKNLDDVVRIPEVRYITLAGRATGRSAGSVEAIE